jgi:hypothetical protein
MTLASNLQKGKKAMIDVWNKSQPFLLADAAKHYGELVCAQQFYEGLKKAETKNTKVRSNLSH